MEGKAFLTSVVPVALAIPKLKVATKKCNRCHKTKDRFIEVKRSGLCNEVVCRECLR